MAIWKGAVEIMGMNKSFWNSKRVLITGHTGFKGSWLTLWLRSLGANVIGYALPPPTEPSIFKLASINDDIINVIGDIRNYSELKMAITKYKPEIIFHLAAQPLVRQTYVNPIDTYSINNFKMNFINY